MGSRRRQNGSKKPTKEQETTLWDKIRTWLTGVQPRIVEEQNDVTACSKETFRAMHDRKLRKGKQIQTVGPIHWLHPRAIMVATLYDSIVICPGAPKRLLACLVFQKSLIRYVDPNPQWYEQKLHATSYSEQSPKGAEVTEGTGIQSYSGSATECQSASEAAPLIHSSSVPATEKPHSVAASEEDEDIRQWVERPQSAGEAACSLTDTFEEEELEAAKAAAQEDFNQNKADLAAIHKILSSPFIQRDAMLTTETEEYKASPSPKRHATPRAAIKITANSANSRSPVAARALFKFKTQEECRERYKIAAGAGDVECAKAAVPASTIAGTAADSAAIAAAAASADTHAKTATEMGGLLDTMLTETGERATLAAQKTALETVIVDTKAELAKLQRSKGASMIKLYQGMEVKSEKAAKHAAAAARKAMEAAQHAHKAAIYAGLLQKGEEDEADSQQALQLQGADSVEPKTTGATMAPAQASGSVGAAGSQDTSSAAPASAPAQQPKKATFVVKIKSALSGFLCCGRKSCRAVE